MRKLFITIIGVLAFVVCGGQQPVTQKPVAVADSGISQVTPAPAETIARSEKPAPAPAKTKGTTDEKPSASQPEAAAEEPALPKLWDFFATWCPPCKQQAPIIEELAEEYKGQIEIVSIDTDKNRELAQKFDIQAIPTLVFLDASGKELSRRVGFFSKESIVARFKAHGFIK